MSKRTSRRLALAAVGVIATAFGAWHAQALPANGWVTNYYLMPGGPKGPAKTKRSSSR